MPYVSLNKYFFHGLPLFGSLLFFLFLSSFQASAEGDENSLYWRHDAIGPVKQVIPIDLYHDGFSEFLVLSESNTVEFLSGDGTSIWDIPLVLEDTVIDADLVQYIGANNAQSYAIVVATDVHLYFYDVDGNLLVDEPHTLSESRSIQDVQVVDIDGDMQDELLITQDGQFVDLFRLSSDFNTVSIIWTDLFAEKIDAFKFSPPQIIQTIVNPNKTIDWIVAYPIKGNQTKIERIHAVDKQSKWNELIAGTLSAAAGELSQIITVPSESCLLSDEASDDCVQIEKEQHLFTIGTQQGFLYLFDMDGKQLWDKARTINSSITALASASYSNAEIENIRLEQEENGVEKKDLEPTIPTIVVGTEAGKILLYQLDGLRIWDKAICLPDSTAKLILEDKRCVGGEPVGEVLSISGTKKENAHYDAVFFSVVFEYKVVYEEISVDDVETNTAEIKQDLLLIDPDLTILNQLETIPLAKTPVLLDTNSDTYHELLISEFGSVALLSGHTPTTQATNLWEDKYRLGSPATNILFDYINDDDVPDLVIGSGKSMHLIETNRDSAFALWIPVFGGEISFLDTLHPLPKFIAEEEVAQSRQSGDPLSTSTHLHYILVGYQLDSGGADRVESHINLATFETKEKVSSDDFQIVVEGAIQAPYLFESNDKQYLIIGTSTGMISLHELIWNGKGWTQKRVWKDTWIDHSIQKIIYIDGVKNPLFVASETGILQLPLDNPGLDKMEMDSISWDLENENENENENEEGTEGECSRPSDLLWFLENQFEKRDFPCYGQTIPDWTKSLKINDSDTIISFSTVQTDNYTYLPIQEGVFWRVNILKREFEIIPDEEKSKLFLQSRKELDELTGFYYGNLSGESSFLSAGESGSVAIDIDGKERIDEIPYNSPIRKFKLLDDEENGMFTLVTDNSVAHLLAFTSNYPPLLTNPTIQYNSDLEQYSIQLSGLQLQGLTTVQLEIFDYKKLEWVPIQDAQEMDENNRDLFWSFTHPNNSTELTYRFALNHDEKSDGMIEPPSYHVILEEGNQFVIQDILFYALLLIGGGIATYYLVYQVIFGSFSSRRLYRRLQNESTLTLLNLQKKYTRSQGKFGWLLQLAERAARKKNVELANLSNGLFLLNQQPEASVPIIYQSLENITDWVGAQKWRALLQTTQKLSDTTQVNDIALYKDDIEQMQEIQRTLFSQRESQIDRLPPIVDCIIASQEVNSFDDRLGLLTDASIMLGRLNQDLVEDDKPTIPKGLVSAIVPRWQALLHAEMESLRGRARLVIRLKTTRLMVTNEQPRVVIEIENVGQASAEDVRIQIHDDMVHPLNSAFQIVPILAPKQIRQVSFEIEHPDPDLEQFRASFGILFNDRQGDDHPLQYANIVKVLAPVQDYKTIQNPYAPGTPLPQRSKMFFGREKLFTFIAEQAPRLERQKVLIMVGQRRTGKTSTLLRLGNHLPKNLVPIYIDCQSLGAMPGEVAFFQDLAWLAEDAMLNRGVDYQAPPLINTGENPLHWFKHKFIPSIRELVSPDATLVLVFDEFEVFENLVADGLLPSSIFNHLRHMMQHIDGISFVFVGTHRLEQMTANYWSVLFNIALYKEIEYLDESSARALITQPVHPHIYYDELALEKIWRITAGHPYFLQLVCYSLVKHTNQNRTGYVTISDVNASVEEMLSLGEVHFAYIWQQSTSHERAILLAMTHLLERGGLHTPSTIVNKLRPYEVRLSSSEVSVALTSLRQRNIIQEVTRGGNIFYELKIELIGLWIEHTKTLSALYESK